MLHPDLTLNLLNNFVWLDENVNLEPSSDLRGHRQSRLEIYVEFMQVFLRIEAFHLLPVVRIGQIEVRKRHESRGAVSARRWVADTRRIANSARTETPIVGVVGSIGKDALRAGKSVRRDPVIFYFFFVVKRYRPEQTQEHGILNNNIYYTMEETKKNNQQLMDQWGLAWFG